MQFTNATTWPMQILGRKDGANAVKKGDGFYFDMMREWNKSDELKNEYPRLEDYLSSK